MHRRLVLFHAFVTSQLPVGSARVLEMGCGDGALALALQADGHEVVAIDPRAPDGPIFRQAALEEFSDGDGFDAVVASVSLHHVEDVGAGVSKLADLLRPSGLVVLEEFAKERLAGKTARWYHEQRGGSAALGELACWEREWAEEHAEVHPFAELRRELDRRFAERHLSWTPYLYSYGLDDALEPVERTLIDEGAIEATGVRYVGALRPQ